MGKTIPPYWLTLGDATGYALASVVNGIAYVTLEITPTNVLNNLILVSNLPISSQTIYHSLVGIAGSVYPIIIVNGDMKIYYSYFTKIERIDCTFSYPL